MNTVEKTINVSTWEQAAEQTALISNSCDNIIGNVSFQWDKTQGMYVIRWTEKETNNVGFLRTKKTK